MQIGGGMGRVVTAVVRTVETQHIVAQRYLCQRSKSCKLYVLRWKGETYFRRYASDFGTAFQSFYQTGDFVGLDICIIIDEEDVFALCDADSDIVATGKTSVFIAADADNCWV